MGEMTAHLYAAGLDPVKRGTDDAEARRELLEGERGSRVRRAGRRWGQMGP